MFKSPSFKFNREEKEEAQKDEKGNRQTHFIIFQDISPTSSFISTPKNPCMTTRSNDEQ